MGPVIALFAFTLRQTLLSRKIWLTVLILAGPCVLVSVIRYFAPPMDRGKAVWEMYHVLSQVFLMSVLLPLVCMVNGTALIGSDVEARTIAYLTTRRMRRATVLLVKFAATALALAVLCDLAMLGVHYCSLVGRDVPSLVASTKLAGWNPTVDLGHYLLIMPLGVVAFLAVFSLIGLLTARPLAVSVFYLVTIELVLSNIPIRVRMYSLLHLLRATLCGLMPDVANLFELPRDLRQELYPASGTGLPELCFVVAAALVLAAILITRRELMPTKVSRE